MPDDSEFKTVIAADEPAVPAGGKAEKAFLIMLSGNAVGEVYTLTHERLLGRGQQCDLRIQGEGISRRHARLTATGDSYLLEDLRSTNGTFINGERVSSTVLKDGDKIQIGDSVVLKFTRSDEFEEEFQRQMYESASRDGLTRVFNKRYFLDRLDSEYSYARRHGSSLALLMFDLDHFKKINDTHGHIAGDRVLVDLAKRVTGVIRNEDVFARYGGEEFVILSRNTDLDTVHPLAERVRESVADHEFIHEGERLAVTVSVGVAALPHDEVSCADDLVSVADRALYAAKRAGRNRVVLFEGGPESEGGGGGSGAT
jgi:diguanylate cyclase (GGDEF)-like protein